jgi:hypothetical protein
MESACAANPLSLWWPPTCCCSPGWPWQQGEDDIRLVMCGAKRWLSELVVTSRSFRDMSWVENRSVHCICAYKFRDLFFKKFIEFVKVIEVAPS